MSSDSLNIAVGAEGNNRKSELKTLPEQKHVIWPNKLL